jgi:hypothetical protein
MGAWGSGLYSSDMAADLRALVRATLRLPVDEDRTSQKTGEGEAAPGARTFRSPISRHRCTGGSDGTGPATPPRLKVRR